MYYKKNDKITIAGAGPSGLSAAAYLVNNNFSCVVHEKSKNLGEKHNNNIQAIKNFKYTEEDFLIWIKKSLGIDLELNRIYKINYYSPSLKKTEIYSKRRPLMYTIIRGTSFDSLENQIGRYVEERNGKIILDKKNQNNADIIATGATYKQMYGYGVVVDGVKDKNSIHIFLENYYTQGGYISLIPYKKLAIILMVCFNSNFFKNVNRNNLENYIKKNSILSNLLYKKNIVSTCKGFANFFIPSSSQYNNCYYVGEAGGYQEYSKGFGLKYAFKTGILAAKAIKNNLSYDRLWREELLNSMINSYKKRLIYEKMTERDFNFFISSFPQKIEIELYSQMKKNFLTKVKSMENNRFDVIIIGSGLAGLTSAYELSKFKKNILLLEKEQCIGGRASREQWKNCYLDRGAAVFMFDTKFMKNFLKKIHISKELIGNLDKEIFYFVDGEYQSINFNSLIQGSINLLESGLISLKNILNINTLIVGLKSYKTVGKMNFNNKYMRKINDKKSIRYMNNFISTNNDILTPLTETFLFEKPSKLSNASIYLLLGSFLTQPKFLYLKGGIGLLSDRLYEIIKSKNTSVLHEAVEYLDKKDNIFHIRTDKKSIYTSKSVIVTAPVPQFTKIIPKKFFVNNSLRNLKKITYPPVISIYFGMKHSTNLDGKLIFPIDKSIKKVRFIGDVSDKSHETKKIRTRIFFVFITQEYTKRLFDKSDEHLLKDISDELQRIGLDISAIGWMKTYKWRYGLPRCTPEYLSYDLHEKNEIDGLFFSGDSNTIGIEYIIKDAQETAKRTNRYLNN